VYLVALLAVLAWLFLRGGGAGTAGDSGDSADGGDMSVAVRKMSEAMAHMEGFFVPNSLPARTHNPGDIGTFGGKVRGYASDEEGFTALDSYITSHAAKHPDWDLYDFVRYYLTGDTMGKAGAGQNPDEYADYVAGRTGLDPTQSIFSQLG
jgi:hypothetical protein